MQYKNRGQGFRQGLIDGVPIALGYISVSFGFGILCVKGGFDALTAVMISLTNVTSAGQLAGLGIMVALGSLMEIIVTEFVINMRYALMSISLTQKLDDSFTTPRRMICAFAMTDEIFAVASSREGKIGAKYFYGLMLLPVVGWVAGTALGALAGGLLPARVTDAMGIALYGMFLAIILPPSTKSRAVAICVAIAAALSILLNLLPLFSFLSSGFTIVICVVIASAVAALCFPLKDSEQNDNAEGGEA